MGSAVTLVATRLLLLTPYVNPSVRDVYDVYNSNALRINISLDCRVTMTVARAAGGVLISVSVQITNKVPKTKVVRLLSF